jgi:hypothetical protein
MKELEMREYKRVDYMKRGEKKWCLVRERNETLFLNQQK